MQHVWHRFVGIRGSTNLFSDQFSSPKQKSNFGKVYSNPSHEIAKHRLVFLGEIHSMPPIISFQREVQAKMKEVEEEMHEISTKMYEAAAAEMAEQQAAEEDDEEDVEEADFEVVDSDEEESDD